jgi:hypothetical protein
MVWPHDKDEVERFHKHLNSIHPNIRFTTKMKDNSLHFLNVLVKRKIKLDGSLGCMVYRKPTHRYLYLDASTYYHPS